MRLALQVKQGLVVSLACASCLLSACASTGSAAGTVEVDAQMGNVPGQPMSQESAEGLQPSPLMMPAEVFAAGISEVPVLSEGQGSATVKDPLALPVPLTSAFSQTLPNNQNPLQSLQQGSAPQNFAAQDSVAQDVPAQTVLEPGAAQAVENLGSAQDRALAGQALGLIQYDWQNSLKGWELRFLGAKKGYRGMTYPSDRVIEVYLRDTDTALSLAHVVAHEMGHAVDLTYFDDGDRRAWTSARKFATTVPWFVAPGGADFSSGCGDFAESFAWWQVGPPTWFGELAPPPTQIQLGVLVNLVLLPGAVR